MKISYHLLILYICKICMCNSSQLPLHRLGSLSNVETSNKNTTVQKSKYFAISENQHLDSSKDRRYYDDPETFDITVALKDESDTSMMKGDTKKVDYRVAANHSFVGQEFILTFKADKNIVNLTNINDDNEMNNHRVCSDVTLQKTYESDTNRYYINHFI